jgi:hypothetical protein
MVNDFSQFKNINYTDANTAARQYLYFNATPALRGVVPRDQKDKKNVVNISKSAITLNMIALKSSHQSAWMTLKDIEYAIKNPGFLEKLATPTNNRGSSGSTPYSGSDSEKATRMNDIKALIESPKFNASQNAYGDLVYYATIDKGWIEPKIILFFYDCINNGHEIYVETLIKGFNQSLAGDPHLYGSACDITKVGGEAAVNGYSLDGPVINFLHWLGWDSPEGNLPNYVAYPDPIVSQSVTTTRGISVDTRMVVGTDPWMNRGRDKPAKMQGADSQDRIACHWDIGSRTIHDPNKINEVPAYTKVGALEKLETDVPTGNKTGVIVHTIEAPYDAQSLSDINTAAMGQVEAGSITPATGEYPYIPHHIVVTTDGVAHQIRSPNEATTFKGGGAESFNNGYIHVAFVCLTNVPEGSDPYYPNLFEAAFKQIISLKFGNFTSISLQKTFGHNPNFTSWPDNSERLFDGHVWSTERMRNHFIYNRFGVGESQLPEEIGAIRDIYEGTSDKNTKMRVCLKAQAYYQGYSWDEEVVSTYIEP